MFKENGFNGFIDATTGAGKTIGACKIILEYLEDFPDATVWVAVPQNILLEQWRKNLDKHGLEDVEVYFYGTAVSMLNSYRHGREADNTPDFLICDEAHVLNSRTSSVWKQIIEFGIEHVLGLSATPNGADKLVGGTIRKVGYDDCAIAPSENHCVIFKPTEKERLAYDKATDSMRGYADKMGGNVSFYNDPVYAMLIMKRKKVLHNMNTRYRVALKYVKENLGKRTILFFTTRAQVNKFAKMLDGEGIDYAVQMTGRKEIEDFDSETGTKDILLCINMLEQGYDDPTLEVGIMVSYANSLTKNIQKVGRLLRPSKGKVAKTYYIIAEGTTDEEIISKRSSIFPPNTVNIIREQREI